MLKLKVAEPIFHKICAEEVNRVVNKTNKIDQSFVDLALKHGVPEHDINSLYLYVTHGIQPGSFLQAVLSNDLMDSFGRADSINREAIFETCSFIYNELPHNCHGSREIVQAWIDKFNHPTEKGE